MTTKVPVELVSLDGGIVINESSADADFRVESNGNANMLFVDGGNNLVSIGGAPVETGDTLNVIDTASNAVIARFISDNDDAHGAKIILQKDSDSPADNDEIAEIDFFGRDDGGNVNQYGAIQVFADDVSSGTEDGIMTFGVISAGTYSEAMRIAPNGDLCVGTVSTVHTSSDIGASVHIASERATGGTDVSLHLHPDTGEYSLYAYDGYLAIIDHTANTERMRILSNGTFCVGTTHDSVDNTNGFFLKQNGQAYANIASNEASYHLRHDYNWRFFVTASGVVNAQSTSINAISDERLKENIIDLETGLDEVLALKPRRFDWIESEKVDTKNIAGFIAQEVETVLPDLVGDFKHDVLTDAKSVKMGDMIPTLVKAIQEQQEQIEQLKTEIQTLKGE